MKHKQIFLFMMLVVLALPTYGQNKIGDNPAVIQPGSLLELESLTKGLRLPRISLNNVLRWTLDGSPVSGMMIFNDSGSETKGIYYWSMDLSQWVRVLNKYELPALITQDTAVKDSIVKVINTSITQGTIKGKDLKSQSPVLTVVGGTGAAVKDMQVDLDKEELGHLFRSTPVADSLAVSLSKNQLIRDSVVSVMKTSTTNTITNPVNTIVTTVNGVPASVEAVNTVTNTSMTNSLKTTVNGVAGIDVNIINSNELTALNGNMVSTVNGVSAVPVQVLISADNGLSLANGNVQLGGNLAKPSTLSATATNTLSITGLQNGDADTDSLLVAVPNTGVVRKISSTMLGTNMDEVIYVASKGEKRFPTPQVFSDVKKIQVYRNGINVTFIQPADPGAAGVSIDLEDSCYADDEIKIIQFK